MSIYLGNLDIEQIERKAGIIFPHELREYMKERKQESAAKVAAGMWHCFDIPFTLVCGDRKTAEYIFKHLSPMAKDFKEPLQIALSEERNNPS